ncbi:MAG TPA: heme-binding domain-containing protein [Aridibacter sp.]|nr:heme-binding domain-containing protein [Aridibacter sp.]
MRTALKVISVLIILAVAGIQFVRPERTNPPVNRAETLEANASVPGEVTSILERSCKDCHSNATEWPWYSNVAPLSWSVAEHVSHGREELNFSEWGTYNDERRQRKLEEICEEVTERQMPHPQYLWLHWDAALSDKEIGIICRWTEASGNDPGRR